MEREKRKSAEIIAGYDVAERNGMGKKSFIIYTDIINQLAMLTDSEAGQLFKALVTYVETGAPFTSDNLALQILFSVLQCQISRDAEKWEQTREKRSEAGRKGMASRWGKAITNDNKNNKAITDITKITVNVNDNVSVNDNVNVNGVLSNDNPQKETTLTSSKEKGHFSYNQIADLWNEICGDKLPKVKALSDTRRNKIKQRLAEGGCKTNADALEWCRGLFAEVSGSAFLCGENNHSWTASFDWIFDNGKNWVKVVEGNYSNNRGSRSALASAIPAGGLGVGEYITPDGRRTYGSGRATIPMNAPARPSERYQWSGETQSWVMI